MKTEFRRLKAACFAKRVVAIAMDLGLPTELYNISSQRFRRRLNTFLTHENQPYLFYVQELKDYVQGTEGLSRDDLLLLYIVDDALDTAGVIINFELSEILEWVYDHKAKKISHDYGDEFTVIKVPTIVKRNSEGTDPGCWPSFKYRVTHKSFPDIGEAEFKDDAYNQLIDLLRGSYPNDPQVGGLYRACRSGDMEGIPYLSNYF